MHCIGSGYIGNDATIHPVAVSHINSFLSYELPHENNSLSSSENSTKLTVKSCSLNLYLIR